MAGPPGSYPPHSHNHYPPQSHQNQSQSFHPNAHPHAQQNPNPNSHHPAGLPAHMAASPAAASPSPQTVSHPPHPLHLPHPPPIPPFDPIRSMWCPEDVVFCIDVDNEINSEMRSTSSSSSSGSGSSKGGAAPAPSAAAAAAAAGSGPNSALSTSPLSSHRFNSSSSNGNSSSSGPGMSSSSSTGSLPSLEAQTTSGSGSSSGSGITRLDAIRQAILLYVHSKTAMDSRHRFALMTLGEAPTWVTRSFTNDPSAISTSLRSIHARGSFPSCDVAALFKSLNGEAQRSNANGRCLRLILIYSRSRCLLSASGGSVSSLHPSGAFIADAIYLHDRPNPTNRPQEIFDMLVNMLEGVSARDTYIFESSSGVPKGLFRMMCVLLAHPLQRCRQDGCHLPTQLEPPAFSSIASSQLPPHA